MTEIDPTRPGFGALGVEYADELRITAGVLANGGGQFTSVDDTGLLVLDTAGEYRYRPVSFAEGGKVVICQRVRFFSGGPVDHEVAAEYMRRYYARMQEPAQPGTSAHWYDDGGQMLSGLTTVANPTDEPEQVEP